MTDPTRISDDQHNNAPAVPEGWRDFLTELSKQKPEKPDYWSSCGQCERNSSTAEDLIAATPAPAPAQDAGLTDEVPAHVAGLLEHRRELDATEFFESTNRDSYEFKKSVRGIYVNPAVARDWKWFQLGMKHATEDES